MLEAFGNEVSGVSTIKIWYEMFVVDRELMEFESHSREPKTMCTVTNINTVANTISTSPRYRIENQLGIFLSNFNAQIGG